jgi:hypothetical protein
LDSPLRLPLLENPTGRVYHSRRLLCIAAALLSAIAFPVGSAFGSQIFLGCSNGGHVERDGELRGPQSGEAEQFDERGVANGFLFAEPIALRGFEACCCAREAWCCDARLFLWYDSSLSWIGAES